MTDPRIPESGHALPPEIAGRLHAFERRLRRMETAAAVFGGLGGALAAYALVFALDRLFDTPPVLRLVLAAAAAAALVAGGVYWGRRWVWARRGSRDLARLVQRNLPAMGDRLLGAVELAEGREDAAFGSPALRRAAIAQVARESAGFDFARAVETRRPRRLAIVCGALAAVVAACAVGFPQAGRNALSRWLRPWAPVERYTFTRIEDLPPELVVPHGEAFEIACVVSGLSRWVPGRAVCRVDDQPRIEARVGGGRAVFRVPGQTRRGTLSLRIGDVVRRIAIRPEYRPELLRLAASVRLPDYLKRPVQELPIEGGAAGFLAGSRVRFEGRANRALESARMAPAGGVAVETTGAVFRTSEIAVENLVAAAASNRAPGTVEFTWRDALRLDAVEPYRLSVAALEDQPPTLQCEGLRGSVAILEDETVEFKARAADDYGLSRLWAEWRVTEDGGAGKTEPLTRAESLAAGAPDRAELSGQLRFSPAARHVPGESTVELWANALDYLPGRAPSQSAVYRIYVLSRAQHAKLLQERVQAVQARLEEAAREEAQLHERNIAVSEFDEARMRSERAASELRETERGERLNEQQLEQLARELADLAKEALRNKDIGTKDVEQWAALAAAMRALAQGGMTQTAGSLQQAQQDEANRAEDLKRALELQREVLRELARMGGDANRAAESLAARNFVNRLREAARRQGDISGAVGTDLVKLAGMEPDRMAEEARATVDHLVGRQQANAREVGYVRDDLAGFFNRTRKELYEEVHKEMTDPDVVADLRAVAGLIGMNQGGRSIEASDRLKDRLNAWADKLEPPKDGGGGGGGGGGGAEESDPELVFGLMRARVRQESLRESTRALDEGHGENRQYPADAGRLADRQGEIEDGLRKLHDRIQKPQIRKFFDAIEQEMVVSQGTLRGPQTDAEAISIQTGIIEMIAEALQASSGKSGSSGAAQMMQQAMSQGQGATGGGSMAGGTTSRENDDATGPGGGAPGRRGVEKGAGADDGALPEEFRDALQGYFNGREGGK